MSKVRVALFPGQGLDQFRSYVVDQDELPDRLAELFGAQRLDSELISPVHALYRPIGKATRPDWFVMVREDEQTGRLVDLLDTDARELPRMLGQKNAMSSLNASGFPILVQGEDSEDTDNSE